MFIKARKARIKAIWKGVRTTERKKVILKVPKLYKSQPTDIPNTKTILFECT